MKKQKQNNHRHEPEFNKLGFHAYIDHSPYQKIDTARTPVNFHDRYSIKITFQRFHKMESIFVLSSKEYSVKQYEKNGKHFTDVKSEVRVTQLGDGDNETLLLMKLRWDTGIFEIWKTGIISFSKNKKKKTKTVSKSYIGIAKILITKGHITANHDGDSLIVKSNYNDKYSESAISVISKKHETEQLPHRAPKQLLQKCKEGQVLVLYFDPFEGSGIGVVKGDENVFIPADCVRNEADFPFISIGTRLENQYYKRKGKNLTLITKDEAFNEDTTPEIPISHFAIQQKMEHFGLLGPLSLYPLVELMKISPKSSFLSYYNVETK